ncbi:hypothetical protein [Bradyrhizobium sp. BR13661]|jgi:diaminopropionate ammonia-lyase|uniref:hypothetical protein n=1 Tax=Bradyrhizobium sp. BR13661 TaxID=2940622 RepID=UPI0024739DFA|nr:hypothetical protein [Bradyrhizobium sp. BR13661]MDH6261770.1 hypothetical protein [Bradyrhizobium sp. BR13661]
MLLIAGDAHTRTAIGLGRDSVVLVVGTEGATDPALYSQIVGRVAESVASDWSSSVQSLSTV